MVVTRKRPPSPLHLFCARGGRCFNCSLWEITNGNANFVAFALCAAHLIIPSLFADFFTVRLGGSVLDEY